jgi:hypothetical protein
MDSAIPTTPASISPCWIHSTSPEDHDRSGEPAGRKQQRRGERTAPRLDQRLCQHRGEALIAGGLGRLGVEDRRILEVRPPNGLRPPSGPKESWSHPVSARRVPPEPTASRRASTTASAPPTTKLRELRPQWTSPTLPGSEAERAELCGELRSCDGRAVNDVVRHVDPSKTAIVTSTALAVKLTINRARILIE